MGAVAGCSLMTDLHSNTQTIRKEGQRSDLPADTLTAWGTCGEKRFPAWEATAPAHTQTMGPSSMQCGRAPGRWPWLPDAHRAPQLPPREQKCRHETDESLAPAFPTDAT